jgi:hypothetical protein
MLIAKSRREYDLILHNVAAKGDYQLHVRGSSSTIISGGQKIARSSFSVSDEISAHRKMARTIMKTVRASVTRYITRNLGAIPEIKQLAPVIYHNQQAWEKLNGDDDFFLVDARHCYWRVAYVLGYISKHIYFRYLISEDYKRLRNISLSILMSGIRREYYRSGEKIHSIECDVSQYRLIYKNIRFFTYNHSGMVRSMIGEQCIGYRTDGIFCTRAGLKETVYMFENNNLPCKITRCIKIDEKNYSTEDGEIKKMV